MPNGQNFEVDLTKLQDEVSAMSPEALREELTKLRTSRKKQQLRSSTSDSAKRYQARAREKYKMLKQVAVENGFWDEVNEVATQRASEELAASSED